MLAASGLAAFALTVSGFSCERIGPPAAVAILGVELPLAGDDGFRGLAARDGVRLALARRNARAKRPVALVLCDSASHVGNPHVDEGSDDPAQAARGAAIVRGFAANPGILAVVGALRPDIAEAEAPVARGFSLALLSAVSTPVAGGSTLFRVAHSDEAEAAVVARFARRAGLGIPSVRSNDATRGAAIRGALGVPSLPASSLFTGPATLGDILADSLASAELERGEILAQMARRGFDFPAVRGKAFAVEPVTGLSASLVADYRQLARAANGAPANDDTIAYDVATTVALESIDAAAASSASDAPSRSFVLRSLRTRTFDTLGGPLRFTHAGAATRSCYSVRALRDGDSPATLECATLRAP